MKHKVSIKLGLALDSAIREFTLQGVLDVVPNNFDKWINNCEPLNDISKYQLAKYIIEGYSYPKTVKEELDDFIKWLDDYDNHTPSETKNSSYRRGRRQVLNNIKAKLDSL